MSTGMSAAAEIPGSPVKIGILVNALHAAGAERVAVNLYEACRGMGVDVRLICLQRGGTLRPVEGPVYYLSDRSDESGPGVIRFLDLVPLATRLKRLVIEEGIDVVQSHMYRSNYVNVLAKLMGGKQVAQIVNHGMPSRYRNNGLAGRVNLALIRGLYPRADQVVCPSADMVEDLTVQAVKGISTVVIPNPFDIGAIREKSNRAPGEGAWVPSPGARYMVAVGRLQSVKRLGDVIEALAVVKRKIPDLELVLVGDGPEKPALREKASMLGLGAAVHFSGHSDNPYYYMARSALLVSASGSEGFGNVLVEAMICGTPVVSSRCPGGPVEIIHAAYGENAADHLFPVGDIQAMAGRIVEILDGGTAAGDHKLSSFLQRLDSANVARDYLRLIESRVADG